MEIRIEVCEICGAQHDRREALSWESTFTRVKSGWSYDGCNTPTEIAHVCRPCRVIITDAVNAAITARSALKTFPPANRRDLVRV